MRNPILVIMLAACAILGAAKAAGAAPAFRQVTGTTACNSPCAQTFASAPTNGDVVSVTFSELGVTSGATVKDSNNVSLTLERTDCAALNALCIATFDYVVTGSPTGTITVTDSSGPGIMRAIQLADISGVVLTGASYAGNTAGSGTVSATIAGVKNTDAQTCLGSNTASSGAPSMTFSNGTITTLIGGSSASGYGLATATASSICTYAPGTSMTNPTAQYADYTVASAGSISIPQVTAYHDMLFERLVRGESFI